jgi:hypothetical protein
MEKLRSLRHIGALVLIFCCLSVVKAQEKLMVFKVKGSPVLKVNDSLKSLSKGSQVPSNSIVSLATNDDLLLINEKGNCFQINDAREYNFSEVLENAVAEDNSSFTNKYFTYVWDQFAKNKKSKVKTGVVYRNDNIVLLEPADSVKIYNPEIKFSWNIDVPESYFLLRDIETNHISKFGTKGSYIKLFVDNEFLVKGKEYQWAVSDTKFPNLDELDFFNFSLLTGDEFLEYKSDIDLFKKELTSLGLSKGEIKVLFCNDYKICY